MDETDQKDSQKDKSASILAQRLEVVCGPTGRRRWSLREKARIVCESFRGDIPVSAVARRNGLRANQLFLWRRQAREGRLVLPAEALDGFAFAPIVVSDDAAGPSDPNARASTPIEIEAKGIVVRLSSATSAKRIGEIAAALRSAQ